MPANLLNTYFHSLFPQECFNEPIDFYGFQTLVSRNETCIMNENCNFEQFLESSVIESEDESADAASEDQLMGNNELSEQDATPLERSNLGK